MQKEAKILGAPELKSSRFFKGFTAIEIGELLKACTLHTFTAGDYVMREDDNSRDVFVILDGSIRIGKTLYAGDDRELGVLGPGDFLGEMAFLDDQPRSASATCTGETTLLRIDKSSFDKMAVRKPRIAYKIMMKIARALGERLRTSNDLVESIFSNPNRTILELKTRLMKIQTMLMRG